MFYQRTEFRGTPFYERKAEGAARGGRGRDTVLRMIDAVGTVLTSRVHHADGASLWASLGSDPLGSRSAFGT